MGDFDWESIGKGFLVQILWAALLAGLWVLALPGFVAVTGYAALEGFGFVPAIAPLLIAKFLHVWFTYNRD